jgi:hypothetical protein
MNTTNHQNICLNKQVEGAREMTGPAVDELNSALSSERDRASIAALHNFLADDFLGKLGNWLNCLLQFQSWNV